MLPGLLAALSAALLFGVAAVAQARSSQQVALTRHVDLALLVSLVRQRMFLLAVGLTLAGFALHLVALRSLPLFLAQGVVSSSVAITALLAVTTMRRHMSRWDWAAVAGVCAGLGLLASSAGPTGNSPAPHLLPVGLLSAVLLLTVAAIVTVRLRGPWPATVLGLLSGTAFGVLGVAVRVLPDLSPSTIVSRTETYALLLAGPLAFLSYSLALQRGSVTTVSAAVVLTQTAMPSLAGVLLLGDTVRSGWEIAALAGFVLAAAGCSELARYENLSQRQRTSSAPAVHPV